MYKMARTLFMYCTFKVHINKHNVDMYTKAIFIIAGIPVLTNTENRKMYLSSFQGFACIKEEFIS